MRGLNTFMGGFRSMRGSHVYEGFKHDYEGVTHVYEGFYFDQYQTKILGQNVQGKTH